MSKRWTTEEDAELLKYLAEGKTLGDISTLMGRPPGGIQFRLVQTHGMRVRPKRSYSPRNRGTPNPWCEEELNILLSAPDTAFIEEIVDDLEEAGYNRTSVEVEKQWRLAKRKPKDRMDKVQRGSKYLAEKHKPQYTGPVHAGASGGSGTLTSPPKEPSQLELLREVIATQKQHDKLIEKLTVEILEVKDFVKASTANAQLVKLNRIISMLAAEHTPLNKLGAGEKLVMMIPDDGDFSTVVKSDRVIIKRVE